VLGLAASDLCLDPAPPQLTPVLVVVVAAVGGESLWSASGPADLVRRQGTGPFISVRVLSRAAAELAAQESGGRGFQLRRVRGVVCSSSASETPRWERTNGSAWRAESSGGQSRG
jgi:hypothetical protein